MSTTIRTRAARTLRNLLADVLHGRPEESDPDADYCHECRRVTLWRGEFCRGCGRQWGYDLEDKPVPAEVIEYLPLFTQARHLRRGDRLPWVSRFPVETVTFVDGQVIVRFQGTSFVKTYAHEAADVIVDRPIPRH